MVVTGTIEAQLNSIEYDYKKRMNLVAFANNFSIGKCKSNIEKKKNLIIEGRNYINNEESKNKFYDNIENDIKKLEFYNGYGGFSADGSEYIFSIDSQKKLPSVWSHVLANKDFGTIVTENFGGYSWYKNSRLNRITAWSNDQIMDYPSEAMYIFENEKNNFWSPCNFVDNPIKITYGMGYAKYNYLCNDIESEVTVFVPTYDAVKVNLITLKNSLPQKRKISFYYYTKLVLDEDEMNSEGKLCVDYIEEPKSCNIKIENSNVNYIDNVSFNSIKNINENNIDSINDRYDNKALLIRNLVNDTFKNLVYITSTTEISSYTGDYAEFFGNNSINKPIGFKLDKLSNSEILGNTLVTKFDVEIEPLSKFEFAICIGALDDKKHKCSKEVNACKNEDKGHKILNQIDGYKNKLAKYMQKESIFEFNYDANYKIIRKYQDLQIAKDELKAVKLFWNNNKSKLKVNTPDKAINFMLNGWLQYQTLVSRMLARSGYYQSGGAYGFRDQLQDSMAVKYFDSSITRAQILKHAKKQFIDGDVLHWWHEDTNRGIRTKFSDDLLWLAYVTFDYIEFTDDIKILDEKISYIQGKDLEDNEVEKYDLYEESSVEEPLYDHCIRAIKRAANFGKHGIPKIGSGDWNDGFSNVGPKGSGESVWLGFFLYDILNKFSKICKERNDNINYEIFVKWMQNLNRSLNNECWDGNWFVRAFTDDEKVLGTATNKECRIDGISQSWSVISGVADFAKSYQAMQSLEQNLVDKSNVIIKLLTPAFDKGDLEPGYIKAYLPGTRENGGQYTHASVWAIIAEALLKKGNTAMEFYQMINPIYKSCTIEKANKYKVEPYVIAADVYGEGNLTGMGGWTWYTGSSSWYYICGIKYLLGIELKDGMLTVNPAVSNVWKEYDIELKLEDSVYRINVKNEDNNLNGVKEFWADGALIESRQYDIKNSTGKHIIEIKV